MCVAAADRQVRSGPGQRLYADASLVATANAALKSVGKHGSDIKLVEDPTKHVTPKATNTKIRAKLGRLIASPDGAATCED